MSLTGLSGQRYSCSSAAAPQRRAVPRSDEPDKPETAFLVYYSPAFLRTVAKAEPLAALQFLAVIYRGSRALWPHDGNAGRVSSVAAGKGEDRQSDAAAGIMREATVTVRIDQLKDLTADKIREGCKQGDRWYIAKRNNVEAVVVRVHPRAARSTQSRTPTPQTCESLPLLSPLVPCHLIFSPPPAALHTPRSCATTRPKCCPPIWRMVCFTSCCWYPRFRTACLRWKLLPRSQESKVLPPLAFRPLATCRQCQHEQHVGGPGGERAKSTPRPDGGLLQADKGEPRGERVRASVCSLQRLGSERDPVAACEIAAAACEDST